MRFFVLAAILLPVTVCFARLFAAVFELSFQRRCRPGCGSCDQQDRLSSPGTGGR